MLLVVIFSFLLTSSVSSSDQRLPYGNENKDYFSFDNQGFAGIQSSDHWKSQVMRNTMESELNWAIIGPPQYAQEIPVENSTKDVNPKAQIRSGSSMFPSLAVDQGMMTMTEPTVAQHVSTEDFIKQAIEDSIRYECKNPSPSRTDIKLNSFFFELCDNAASMSIPAETHLKWFISFARTYVQPIYTENLIAYFDYIKTLIDKTDSRVRLVNNILNVIDNFIFHRCLLPEVISQSLEMVRPHMEPYLINSLYMRFKNSVLKNTNLSVSGIERYLKVLGSFLELFPNIPNEVVFIKQDETYLSRLRIAIHLSHFYKVLMGFQESTPEAINYAISKVDRYLDGSKIAGIDFDLYYVIDSLIKRAFSRIILPESICPGIILERFESFGNIYIKFLFLKHLKTFIRGHLDNLVDFYCYFTSKNKEQHIEFVDFVQSSYDHAGPEKYAAMKQIIIYISYYKFSLTQFREEHKGQLLGRRIDEEFVLLLEAIIAAVEDIDSTAASYVSWEPSSELLSLQAQILPDGRHQFIKTRYIMFAARIFLSRKTGFPVSVFPDSFSEEDSTWLDAIGFIDFYLKQVFKGNTKVVKRADLEPEGNVEQTISIHEAGESKNTKQAATEEYSLVEIQRFIASHSVADGLEESSDDTLGNELSLVSDSQPPVESDTKALDSKTELRSSSPVLPSSSIDQSMTKPAEPVPASTELFIMQAIFDSICHDYKDHRPSRTDIRLNSFIYRLRDNASSLSISSETHLRYFFAMARYRSKHSHNENLFDYFDYIKEFHLMKETEFSYRLVDLILENIIELISSRCIFPEIISQLLEIVANHLHPEQEFSLFDGLKQSILKNENLSRHGHFRYLKVLESFLEFIPSIPHELVSIDQSESRVNNLRIALHLSHFYKLLMGFDESSSPEEDEYVISNLNCNFDGSVIVGLGFETPLVIDTLLKRAYSRIVHPTSITHEIAFDRFESFGGLYVKSLLPENLRTFVTSNLNNLVDCYLFFTSKTEEQTIGFVEFVQLSYGQPGSDKYAAMKQIIIYISYYEFTLKEFREEYKGELLGRGIDEDFVLVLEAIIAAVEDIESTVAFYETWEPSKELLILQAQIVAKGKQPVGRQPIIESHYIMFAARIFLSRVTGFPVSVFPASILSNEDFIWKDAIHFVNFYFEHVFKGNVESFRVKSQFLADLGPDATFEQIIALHDSKKYKNIQKTINDLDV